jgi:hypothetical protein
MSAAHTPYLTAEQVQNLNEKHGWLKHADAQGEASRAFVQEAIAMHERIRDMAFELLAIVQKLAKLREGLENGNSSAEYAATELARVAGEVAAKATGVTR